MSLTVSQTLSSQLPTSTPARRSAPTRSTMPTSQATIRRMRCQSDCRSSPGAMGPGAATASDIGPEPNGGGRTDGPWARLDSNQGPTDSQSVGREPVPGARLDERLRSTINDRGLRAIDHARQSASRRSGKRCSGQGWPGVLYPAAARSGSLALCVFRTAARLRGVKALRPPTRRDEPPVPPRGSSDVRTPVGLTPRGGLRQAPLVRRVRFDGPV